MNGQAATIDERWATDGELAYRETNVAGADLLESAAELPAAAGEGISSGLGERESVNPVGSSTFRKVLHIAGGALPAITVATVIPLALFYGVSAVAGMKAGIVASLAWAYLMLGRQIIQSRRMSGVLTITAFTLTVRCITWVVHQSAFTYFVVPVFETIGMSLLFVVTLAMGRPLLVSLARDFVPSLGDRLGHSDHKRLVRDLSCVWGAVYLGSATSSAVLLQTQSMHLFLVLHQMSGWVWTGSGIVVTCLYARRHAQELMAVATSNLRVAAA